MTILDSDKCTDGKQIRKYFLEKREKKKVVNKFLVLPPYLMNENFGE